MYALGLFRGSTISSALYIIYARTRSAAWANSDSAWTCLENSMTSKTHESKDKRVFMMATAVVVLVLV